MRLHRTMSKTLQERRQQPGTAGRDVMGPHRSPDRDFERSPLRFLARLARLARLAYEYFVLYFGYLYFGIGCALCSLAAAALHPILPGRFGARLGRWITGVHFRGFLALLRASGLVRIDLAALDLLRGERSIIIAPNHP